MTIKSNWAQFDGVDDYIDAGVNERHKIVREITLEAWIWVNEFTTGKMGILTKAFTDGDSLSGYGLLVNNGTIEFHVAGPDHTSLGVSTTAESIVLQPSQWYHIAATHYGTDCFVYINGQTVGTRHVDSPANIAYDPDPRLMIGRVFAGPNRGPSYFNGRICEARIWNIARLQIDILASMEQELAQDTPGLVSRWALDSTSGIEAVDKVSNDVAVLNGGITWGALPPPVVEEPPPPPPPNPVTPPPADPPTTNDPPPAPEPPPPPAVKKPTGFIDTSGVVAAALERLNRKSVISLLNNLIDEVERQRNSIPTEISNATSGLIGRLDALEGSSPKGRIGTLEGQMATVNETLANYCDLTVKPTINSKKGEIISDAMLQVDTKLGNYTTSLDFEDLKSRVRTLELAPPGSSGGVSMADLAEKLNLVLQDMDLGKILVGAKVRLGTGPKTVTLIELMTILAAPIEVVSTSFAYNDADIIGATFRLSNETEVRFDSYRIPLGDNFKYRFETGALNGMSASFEIEFARNRSNKGIGGSSFALDQYDVVSQSNVYYDLTVN